MTVFEIIIFASVIVFGIYLIIYARKINENK